MHSHVVCEFLEDSVVDVNISEFPFGYFRQFLAWCASFCALL